MNAKEIYCNLCGSKNHQEFLKKNENSIVKCQNCGLVFVNPSPSDRFLNKLYQREYFDPQNRPCYRISNYLTQRPIFEKYFSKELERISQIKKKGKILDLGCGPGFFLNLAKKSGFESYGVDISSFAIKYAKEKFNLNVFCGSLSQAKFPDNFFDIVTIFQTIEHIKDPFKFLKETNRVLKKDGFVVLTTPNQESFMAKILGKKWFGYFYLAHLYFFTPQTLRAFLLKSGFSKIKPTSYTLYYLSLAEVLERLYRFYPSFLTRFGTKLISLLGRLAHLRFIPLAITGKSIRILAFKE